MPAAISIDYMGKLLFLMSAVVVSEVSVASKLIRKVIRASRQAHSVLHYDKMDMRGLHFVRFLLWFAEFWAPGHP